MLKSRLLKVSILAAGAIALGSSASLASGGKCTNVEGYGYGENKGTAKVQARDAALRKADVWAGPRLYKATTRPDDCKKAPGIFTCEAKAKVCIIGDDD